MNNRSTIFLLLLLLLGVLVSLFFVNNKKSHCFSHESFFVYIGEVNDTTCSYEDNTKLLGGDLIVNEKDAYFFGKTLLKQKYGDYIDSMVISVELINDSVWSVYTTNPYTFIIDRLEKFHLNVNLVVLSSYERVNFRKDNGKVLLLSHYK